MAPWFALAGAVAVTAVLARPPESTTPGAHQAPLLPRKEVLLVAGAGYRELVADYFWLQTLQATIRARTAEEFHDIYDYAKLVTELDPNFLAVYPFAGAALPTRDQKGVWRNVKESTELLAEGHRRFPDHVVLGILYAFNLSNFEKEYRKAADVLAQIARLPDAPPYLGPLAARMYAQAGEFDVGLEFATQIAQSAEDPESKAVFERRVKQLKLERVLRQVDAAVEEYRKANGRPPASVQELVDRHLLPAVPEDPFEGEIVIGSDLRSHSTKEHERLQLYSDEETLK